MPKKKKGGKKKGGKKGKKKGQNDEERLEMIKKTKDLLKLYTSTCAKEESSTGTYLVSSLKECIEEEKPLSKAILDPLASQRMTVAPSSSSKGVVAKKRSSPSVTGPATAPEVAPAVPAVASTMSPKIKLKPLLRCFGEVKYHYIRCLHLWYMPLAEEDLVSLALFMASPVGTQIRVLDLTGNYPTTWGIKRLSRSFVKSQLVHLTLDYNRLSADAVDVLCQNLKDCLTLLSLNLNYCHMTPECGEPLGLLISASQIRHLGIQGNTLQSRGVQALLSCLAVVAETSESMPLLGKLYLQDNEIDGCGRGGVFAPIMCMQILGRWLARSKSIEEVRLEGNLIGDAAARELMLTLQQRKEIGLPAIKVGLTNRMCTDVFSQLMELTGTAGGKKKGKGKKKKKK
ncbi:PREDICTED: uncharacterized protein LOC109581132 [Amphimedon queenslandica]|nr:PREDICTED: uncharacterized protein LOC109581132 [Amphimedon queenslandica]|eukprot:XP_019850505.1 PREDICTED: uncharacterized protein LOC109581132 [Amphimedon queenslandica]